METVSPRDTVMKAGDWVNTELPLEAEKEASRATIIN